jgi:amicyanin
MSARASAALLVALAVAMALVVTADRTPVRAGTSHSVDIADFAFSPQTLTVQVGDTVTWTNRDAVQHTATSTSGAFDSGLLDQNASYSLTFTQAGTYDYLCTPHPDMTARIVVQAAPAATPATGGGGSLPDVAMPAPGTSDAALPIALAVFALVVGLSAALVHRRRTAD